MLYFPDVAISPKYYKIGQDRFMELIGIFISNQRVNFKGIFDNLAN